MSMFKIHTKRLFCSGSVFGLLILSTGLAFASGYSPLSEDEILRRLGLGSGEVTSNRPAPPPPPAVVASRPAPAAQVGNSKKIMSFQGVASADEILTALGLNKTRSIKCGAAACPKKPIKTANTVYPAAGAASASASASASAPDAPPPSAAATHQSAASTGVAHQFQAPSSQEKMSVAFPGLFATGSAEITARIDEQVRFIAIAMQKKGGLKLLISGHTDVSGSDVINNRLSLKRAEAVKWNLVRNHSIDSSRLRVTGEGSRKLANHGNPYGQENRRFQIDQIID